MKIRSNKLTALPKWKHTHTGKDYKKDISFIVYENEAGQKLTISIKGGEIYPCVFGC